MAKVLISLIGEQPVPNLLPIRYLKPEKVLLAYIDLTKKVYERLKRLLEPEVKVYPLEKAEPYDIPTFVKQLTTIISQHSWSSSEMIFNLTGGTKPMGFAAYEVARAFSSHFIYLHSEGSKSKLFFYQFKNGQAFLDRHEFIPNVLNIHDYLMSFVGRYHKIGFSKQQGGKFEEAIYNISNSHLASRCYWNQYYGSLKKQYITSRTLT